MRYPYIILLTVLTACSTIQPDLPRKEKPLTIPEGIKPVTLELDMNLLSIPTDDIRISHCYAPLFFSKQIQDEIPSNRDIEIELDRQLYVLGYNSTLSFPDSADYSLQMRLISFNIDACKSSSFSILDENDSMLVAGEAEADIELIMTDKRSGNIVFKDVKPGYSNLEEPTPNGIKILIEDVMTSSLYHLGTDRKFHSLNFDLPPSNEKSL
mgnify:FL=1|tara:strand:+ start:3630 stop:4262 length:633 start_codon:yes stop_codon:yes gene_type:complete